MPAASAAVSIAAAAATLTAAEAAAAEAAGTAAAEAAAGSHRARARQSPCWAPKGQQKKKEAWRGALGAGANPEQQLLTVCKGALKGRAQNFSPALAPKSRAPFAGCFFACVSPVTSELTMLLRFQMQLAIAPLKREEGIVPTLASVGIIQFPFFTDCPGNIDQYRHFVIVSVF